MNPFARLLPRTLFGRAALNLTLSFTLFTALVLVAVNYYIMSPVTERSAQDLADLMVLSAQSWATQPVPSRVDYSKKLYDEHQIWLTNTERPIPPSDYVFPYMLRVEQALKQRTGYDMPLRPQVIDGRRWFWVDMDIGGQRVRVGFSRDRIATRPLTGFLLVLLASTILVLLTSMILARRITRPLTRLADAVAQFGKGLRPEPVPASGVREVDMLSRQFNRMSGQVRELLDNRTTLLAGISHDLRTPITRMRLAVEMLPPQEAPALIEGLKQDLEQMDKLISESLEMSRDLEGGEKERLDLSALLSGLVADLGGGQVPISWTPRVPCEWPVNVTALRRILLNLAENALRYGAGEAVDIELSCDPSPPVIRILDRGPGIPADQKEAVFRPFYRLEASRSTATGGSGLGLAIVRQLVTANGMDLQLLDREGGGTIARLRLPLVDDRPVRV